MNGVNNAEAVLEINFGIWQWQFCWYL